MSPISCLRWLLSLLTFSVTSWRILDLTSRSLRVISFLNGSFFLAGFPTFTGAAFFGAAVFFLAADTAFFAMVFAVFFTFAMSFSLFPVFPAFISKPERLISIQQILTLSRQIG